MSSLNFLVDFCHSAEDVYSNIEYISEVLINNKILGFKNISVTDDEFGKIMTSLYRGHQSPLQLKPGTIYDQNHLHDEDTLTEDVEHFIYSRWHVDNPFYEQVPCYTGMHMNKFECLEAVGQTHFLDLNYMYEMCPKYFLQKLDSAKIIHATGYVHGSTEKLHPHPAIIYHPITKQPMIYWTGHDIRLYNEDSSEWFASFKIWVSEFVSDIKNRKTWSWSQGDVLIWDNRAVAHSFSPGWAHEQRVFTRCEVGLEVPFAKKPI